MSVIKLDNKELDTSAINCVHQALIKNDPGVMIRIKDQGPLSYTFRTTGERQRFWEHLWGVLSTEGFIASPNSFFRPSIVQYTEINASGDPLPYIVIGFHDGFAILTPYMDKETMQVHYENLLNLLSLYQTKITNTPSTTTKN